MPVTASRPTTTRTTRTGVAIRSSSLIGAAARIAHGRREARRRARRRSWSAKSPCAASCRVAARSSRWSGSGQQDVSHPPGRQAGRRRRQERHAARARRRPGRQRSAVGTKTARGSQVVAIARGREGVSCDEGRCLFIVGDRWPPGARFRMPPPAHRSVSEARLTAITSRVQRAQRVARDRGHRAGALRRDAARPADGACSTSATSAPTPVAKLAKLDPNSPIAGVAVEAAESMGAPVSRVRISLARPARASRAQRPQHRSWSTSIARPTRAHAVRDAAGVASARAARCAHRRAGGRSDCRARACRRPACRSRRRSASQAGRAARTLRRRRGRCRRRPQDRTRRRSRPAAGRAPITGNAGQPRLPAGRSPRRCCACSRKSAA